MVKNQDGLGALGGFASRNLVFHVDVTTMNETDIASFSSKAKRNLFCSVVIADGGKLEDYNTSYIKIQATFQRCSVYAAAWQWVRA